MRRPLITPNTPSTQRALWAGLVVSVGMNVIAVVLMCVGMGYGLTAGNEPDRDRREDRMRMCLWLLFAAVMCALFRPLAMLLAGVAFY